MDLGGSRCLSVDLGGSLWVLVVVGVVVIGGYRLISVVIGGSWWFSVDSVGSRCLSVVLGGYRRILVVLGGSWWLSL